MRRRAGETRELKAKGLEPVLKGSRWWFLKRSVNLTEKQVEKLVNVVRYNLRTVRSYLLKEEFHFFWDYKSGIVGGVVFLDQWCTKTIAIPDRANEKGCEDASASSRN